MLLVPCGLVIYDKSPRTRLLLEARRPWTSHLPLRTSTIYGWNLTMTVRPLASMGDISPEHNGILSISRAAYSSLGVHQGGVCISSCENRDGCQNLTRFPRGHTWYQTTYNIFEPSTPSRIWKFYDEHAKTQTILQVKQLEAEARRPASENQPGNERLTSKRDAAIIPSICSLRPRRRMLRSRFHSGKRGTVSQVASVH